MKKQLVVALSESPSKLPTGHWDLTKRVPPRSLGLKLKRLRRRMYLLRLELKNYGYYNDVSGHLGDAEMAIHQAELGNVWRNEFHKRKGTQS